MNKPWSLKSWKKLTAQQQPVYEDQNIYNSVLKQISSFPPLVSIGEINILKKQVVLSAQGKNFILHGGDCAERFIDCNENSIINKIKILLQMSVILTYGARRPVVRIGRIAGQYFKPRSRETEIVDGKSIPVYRGDSVNMFLPVEDKRKPDPQRLLQTFYNSSITLNYIRSIISGGFADLHYPFNWNLHSMEKSSTWPRYRETVDRILDAINFMESFGGLQSGKLGTIDFFTSHEGLHLGYESALTRKDPDSGKYYNLGAHMLWIGDRTRSVHEAHIEYFRGISNPIGMKIGPQYDTEEILDSLHVLNPYNEDGKVILITRMGKETIDDRLPPLVKAVKKSGLPVVWSCDPMHGNIITSEGNRKTRRFDDILYEIKKSFKIHSENGTILSGVHFELTGDNVTECMGGSVNIEDKDLTRNYETYCDPRLNYYQSMEMAFLIAELLDKKYPTAIQT